MSQKKLSEEQKARKRLREKERRERKKTEKAKKPEPAGTADPSAVKALDVTKEIEKLGGIEVLDTLVMAYAAAKLLRIAKEAMKCAVTKCLEEYVDSTGFIVTHSGHNAEAAAKLAEEALKCAVSDFAKDFKIEVLKVFNRGDGK